jgi:hypothetical protein
LQIHPIRSHEMNLDEMIVELIPEERNFEGMTIDEIEIGPREDLKRKNVIKPFPFILFSAFHSIEHKLLVQDKKQTRIQN